MSHIPLDPDPLDVTDAYAEGFRDGWTSTKPNGGLAGLLIAALSGAFVGAALMWLLR